MKLPLSTSMRIKHTPPQHQRPQQGMQPDGHGRPQQDEQCPDSSPEVRRQAHGHVLGLRLRHSSDLGLLIPYRLFAPLADRLTRLAVEVDEGRGANDGIVAGRDTGEERGRAVDLVVYVGGGGGGGEVAKEVAVQSQSARCCSPPFARDPREGVLESLWVGDGYEEEDGEKVVGSQGALR